MRAEFRSGDGRLTSRRMLLKGPARGCAPVVAQGCVLRGGRPAVILLMLATLATAGCAKTIWTQPGITEQSYHTDTYECERDVRQSGYYGGGIAGALNMRDFYERCMRARGYRKATEEEINSPGFRTLK